MHNIEEIRKIWNKNVLDKTITKILYDDVGITGFLLNDGTRIGYDFKSKGLFLSQDEKGDILKYN